jgi:peptidylprolyl isomerase
MRKGLKLKAAFAALAIAALALPAGALTPKEVLDASKPAEWRRVDPQHTLYLDIESGRVVIELAPGFAPNHTANIEALVRAGYFDHAFIVRSQDNYVVQWSQPNDKAPMGLAQKTLKAEFDRPIDPAVPFDVLPDPDTYAPEVGFAWGMPAARDPKLGRMWLAHCYGMVGAGRDNDADSGGGTELYAVNGQSPRQLDRNVTLVGRVIDGMELLSSLPRGTGDLGFYKTDGERIPIQRVRIAADVPSAERVDYETLKTDSDSFKALTEARRNRVDAWYKVPAGRIGLCNVQLPVRPVPHH